MKTARKSLLIGVVATRTGIAVSAIRHYETEGLIRSERNSGGQRLFAPADIRRISFIIISQKMGFSLKHIRTLLNDLPHERTPTKKDWERISLKFSKTIDERIAALNLLKNKLTSCIGCGCLSLKTCALYNKDDNIAVKGAGPRFLMGDTPSQ